MEAPGRRAVYPASSMPERLEERTFHGWALREDPREGHQGRWGEAPEPGLTLGVATGAAAEEVAGDGVVCGVHTTRSSNT
jgi:hypothetical protein